MSVASPLVPDAQGRFGPYGGRFVPETLMYALRQLTEHYDAARADPEFQRQFAHYLRQYVGRPSPLYFAERLTQEAGGARIYLKREDLNHTGAHKINNALGQAMLTRRMGKKRVSSSYSSFWKIASSRAARHAASSSSSAGTSVSGTNLPPYAPNRPRASGTDDGAVTGSPSPAG